MYMFPPACLQDEGNTLPIEISGSSTQHTAEVAIKSPHRQYSRNWQHSFEARSVVKVKHIHQRKQSILEKSAILEKSKNQSKSNQFIKSKSSLVCDGFF